MVVLITEFVTTVFIRSEFFPINVRDVIGLFVIKRRYGIFKNERGEMRITVKKSVESDELIAMTCDVCHKTYTTLFEMQEFECIDRIGGYGSVIGDGTKVEIDICEPCFKKMFEKYYRTANEVIL